MREMLRSRRPRRATPQRKAGTCWVGVGAVIHALTDELLTVARGIPDALVHAHEKGVVHRALKPANVLLVGSPIVRVQVADFGLARSYEESGASGFHRGHDESATIRFMAPEQIIDFRNVGPAADLYALSTVLYVAATGQHPLTFAPGSEPFLVILEEEAEPVAKHAPHLPAAVAAAVDRGLRKDVDDRFPSAAAMRAALG